MRITLLGTASKLLSPSKPPRATVMLPALAVGERTSVFG
jgi:hypothetical protein